MEIKEFSRVYQQQVTDLILSIPVAEFNVSITAEAQPDLKNISEFYQKGNGNFWVALDNENVIGTIALVDIGNNIAALRKMFVHKNWRGKEKATAQHLLNTVLNWSKENKIEHIYLGTIERFYAARRFYEKNGFTEISKSSLPSSFPVMTVDDHFYHYCV